MDDQINLFKLGKKLSKKNDEKTNSMIVFELESHLKECLISGFFDSDKDKNFNDFGIKYNIYSKSKNNNTKDYCQIWKLKNKELTEDIIKICFSNNQNGHTIIVFLIDLANPESIFNTINFIETIRQLIINLIKNDEDFYLKNSFYKLATQNKSVESFPIPLIIIGYNFIKFLKLDDEKRDLIQKYLRHFCFLNFSVLYFLNEQSEYSMYKCKALIQHLSFEKNFNDFEINSEKFLYYFGQEELNQIYTDKILSWKEIDNKYIETFMNNKKNEEKILDENKISLFLEPDIDLIYNFNSQKLEFSQY